MRELIRIRELIERNNRITIVSHCDADGLSSAIILAKALKRMNKEYNIKILTTLTTQDMEDSINEEGLPIFLDFGSVAVRKLKSIDKPVIVIDHHYPPSTPAPSLVIEVNANNYGIDGSTEITTSIMTYLLTEKLGKNYDLVKYAIAGLFGDFDEPAGISKEIIEKAQQLGIVREEFYPNYSGSLTSSIAYAFDPSILEKAGIKDTRKKIEELTLDERIILTALTGAKREYIINDPNDTFNFVRKLTAFLNASGKL